MHETHLIQIFQNLIANAIKYRGPNKPRHSACRASARAPRGGSRSSDNGIGIPREYQEQVFGSSSASTARSTLGRASASRSARRSSSGTAARSGSSPLSGGARRSTSKSHERAERPGASGLPRRRQRGRHPSRAPRLPAERDGLRSRSREERGGRPLEAHESFARPPDLVLLDINLPRVNGLAVLRAMRQRPDLSTTSVVILTSSDAPATAKRPPRWASGDSSARRRTSTSSSDRDGRQGDARSRTVPDAPSAGLSAPGFSTRLRLLRSRSRSAIGLRRARASRSSRCRRPPRSLVRRGPAPVRQEPSPRHPAPPRRGQGAPSIALWAVPFGAAAMIAVAGFVGHDQIEGIMVSDLRSDLESRVKLTSQALSVWFEMKGATAKIVAAREQDPGRRREARSRSGSEAARRAPGFAVGGHAESRPRLRILDERVRRVRVVHHARGRGLVSSEAPGSRLDIGGKECQRSRVGRRDGLCSSTWIRYRPPTPAHRRCATGLRRGAGAVAEDAPIAVLALRLPLAQGFARMTSGARWAKRRDSRLRSVGEALDREPVRGRSPGDRHPRSRRELADEAARRATRAATSRRAFERPCRSRLVLSRKRSRTPSRTQRGRRHRGVPRLSRRHGRRCLGWLPDLELGVVFKMDASEAFAAMRHLRTRSGRCSPRSSRPASSSRRDAAFLRRRHAEGLGDAGRRLHARREDRRGRDGNRLPRVAMRCSGVPPP